MVCVTCIGVRFSVLFHFMLTIIVIRCKKFMDITDGWKICHPSDDMRRGGRCRFGCYDGHRLRGARLLLVKTAVSGQMKNSRSVNFKVSCGKTRDVSLV